MINNVTDGILTVTINNVGGSASGPTCTDSVSLSHSWRRWPVRTGDTGVRPLPPTYLTEILIILTVPALQDLWHRPVEVSIVAVQAVNRTDFVRTATGDKFSRGGVDTGRRHDPARSQGDGTDFARHADVPEDKLTVLGSRNKV